MKYKYYLQDALGIDIYPLISLVLFTAVFAFVIFLVLKLKKTKVDQIKQLPLE